MGSRTMDFWLEFEMNSSSLPSKHGGDPHKSLHRFVVSKVSKTLKINVFVWRHNFPLNHASNRETEPVCGSTKVPGISGKVFPTPENGENQRKSNESGRAQIVSTRRFWRPSDSCWLNLRFLLKITFSSNLWRSFPHGTVTM